MERTDDIVLDHFFSFNDIVVCPLYMAKKIPAFELKLKETVATVSDYMAFVAKVSATGLLTRYKHDSITAIQGMGIIDLENRELVQLISTDLQVLSTIVKFIQRLLLAQFTYKIKIDAVNFNDQVSFFTKHEFVDPSYDPATRSIIVISKPSMPPAVVEESIKKILTAVRTEKHTISVIVPHIVAEILSKSIYYLNEAMGSFIITRFLPTGEAVLGINSDDVKEGSAVHVDAELTKSPFSFHSHPEHITRTTDAFIAWPSGQDIYSIAKTLTTAYPQILHFVASPEGVWIIKPTFALQLLLKTLAKLDMQKCIKDLLLAIFQKFTQLDLLRMKSTTEASSRHLATEYYISTVGKMTLKYVIPDFDCNKNIVAKFNNSALFAMDYVEWGRFFDIQNVKVTVEYIPDAANGLPIII